MTRLRRSIALACATAGLAAGAAGAPGAGAHAAPWHLDASFGKGGVAALPVREEGVDSLYPPGPGATGALLAPGPQGSLFAGGYADRRKGTFLIARISTRGKLVKSFGHGGVTTVPAIYSTPQEPPRMLVLAGGRPLVVGLDRARRLVVARLTARGRPDRSFGHDGVARYALAGASTHPIIAAAAVERDGDVLAVYFPKEVQQPVNEPRVAPGLGEGPIELLRLLSSGAPDRSFGEGGFLRAAGAPPPTRGGPASGVAVSGVAVSADGSTLIAYEGATIPNGDLAEVPAVQELTPAGADAPGFGHEGVAFLPFEPKFEGESSSIFEGLFALAGGGVEVSFGGGGQLVRFTPAGAPDPAFGASGHTPAGPRILGLAVAPDGESFMLRSNAALTVAGVLADGAPDSALGGSGGRRFAAARLPRRRGNEERQAVELLAGNATLNVLVGEDVLRISD